jgi:catechol 2,3-dioxygenase-like lactoylglutathione lyase family enzyme
MAPQVHGPHHLAIQVSDLPAAERFYREVLGLEVVKRWPFEDGRAGERSVWLSLGGPGFLALEACDGARPPPPFRDPLPGLHLFALGIDRADRAAWEQRLGDRVVHRTRYTLYVRDPEGNRIGLSHYPDEA